MYLRIHWHTISSIILSVNKIFYLYSNNVLVTGVTVMWILLIAINFTFLRLWVCCHVFRQVNSTFKPWERIFSRESHCESYRIIKCLCTHISAAADVLAFPTVPVLELQLGGCRVLQSYCSFTSEQSQKNIAASLYLAAVWIQTQTFVYSFIEVKFWTMW